MFGLYTHRNVIQGRLTSTSMTNAAQGVMVTITWLKFVPEYDVSCGHQDRKRRRIVATRLLDTGSSIETDERRTTRFGTDSLRNVIT